MLRAARFSLDANKATWGALALLVGLAVSVLPLPLAVAAVGAAVIGMTLLVEPVLALALMLGIAPLKTLIQTESPLALPVDAGQLLFALVVGLWLVTRVLYEDRRTLPRTRIFVPLAIIMLGFGPSLFVARSAGAWVSEMVKWVEMALLVAVVLELGARGRWRWIAFAAVLSAALQALIGIYEYQGGSGAPHLWVSNYTHFRAFGTFGQPNPFSAFMGLTVPLALGLAWGYLTQAWAQWQAKRDAYDLWGPSLAVAALYAGLGVLILGGLVVSLGRGAWLGFGAAAGVMVFFAPRNRWLAVALVGAGIVLGVSLWLTGLLPTAIQARIDNAVDEFTGFGDVRGLPISDENFAIIERLAHWQAALNMAQAHPWLGVGLGSYEAAYNDYRVPSWPRPLGHAHNDYLNLLAETGIVGLTTYLFGWVLIVFWTIRALHQNDPVLRGLVLGLLGVWTHLAVHSFVDKLYVNNLFLHIGVVLGLLAVAWTQRSPLSEGVRIVIKVHSGER
ncbi:MAG TPA: O-antigen ligase family protein [Aggregatilinea sp.]|uniref:O-antigen ligase family protein n=1 Tax=Aggregatilinea sp. TaxID=2806333 RepID=UPI002C6742B5|nr:O-antigen ligase family protein [Aggregatilinea sp.]HML21261.1 O-antigen ligase family protein [Aggregatilinea sp.]